MMSAILGMCEGATEIVQRPISANPGLNFYPGMFFFSSKVFSLAIFSSNFLYSCKSGQSSNCRQKRIQLNLLSKLLYLISNFALTLGYLNPTLNSPAQSYNPTSHKATTIRTLTRRAQLVCDSPDSLQDETDYLNNVLVRTITTRTLLDGTLTVTLIPTLNPTSTLALLRQRLYRTSEAPLKLSHVYYNLTIYVLHTNR